MMKDLLIIGVEGNGSVIVSCARDTEKWKPELGTFDVAKQYKYVVHAMTTARGGVQEIVLFEDFSSERGWQFYPTIVHPTAVVSDTASLSFGVVLMPHVVVGPNVTLGRHVQMYAQSFVGHNSFIGNFVFIANNASVGGHCFVHKGAYLGAGCCIREQVTIGEYALVGMGSVVLNDVQPYEIVVGNPARHHGWRLGFGGL